MASVEGPGWSLPGLDIASGRYPLRVESHVSQMVDRLLPGVTTITTHARQFMLHPLVWAEAGRRGLGLEDSLALLRRCEVVVAGVSVLHEHSGGLPAAHGAGPVEEAITETGCLPVAQLQQPGGYSQVRSGFFGAYRGSETRLGLLSTRSDGGAAPGERFEEGVARRAFDGLFSLAGRDSIDPGELRAASHLCVCAGAQAGDGGFLRRLLCEPGYAAQFRKLDSARRATARLLGRVLAGGALDHVESRFSRAVRCGLFVEGDAVAATLPESKAWRGVALRNFTVGAWRRLWSLLVDDLDEPRSVVDLTRSFAERLPEMSVAELFDSLPPSMRSQEVLDAEGVLRSPNERDPLTELSLLALAAKRVRELDEETCRAYSPRQEEVLSPHWLRAYFDSRYHDPLPAVAVDIGNRLVDRSQRVALSKMQVRPNGSVWIPTRVREREGVLIRINREGWVDVGLRIGSFASVLLGVGVLAWTAQGYTLSEWGKKLIG